MLEFACSSHIAAPIEAVWGFYARPDAPKLLTPPWQPVTVVGHQGGLAVGATTEYCLQIGPAPLRWVTRQTACLPQRLFVEETIEGPVRSWVLRHELAPAGREETRLSETIAYRLLGGAAAEGVLARWTHARLRDMFAYRHRIIRGACEPSQKSLQNLTQ